MNTTCRLYEKKDNKMVAETCTITLEDDGGEKLSDVDIYIELPEHDLIINLKEFLLSVGVNL